MSPVPLLLAQALAASQPSMTSANHSFDQVFEQLKADKKKACAEYDGEMAVEDRPINAVADFNGDGIVDPIVPEAKFACSTAATLFSGGTGGSTHHIFVSNSSGGYDRFDLLGQDYQVMVWDHLPIILLPVHFSICGIDRPSTCIVSYTYHDGQFQAAGQAIAPEYLHSNQKGK